ncbi:KR-domain-containing protein [Zopfia rhizophila CBS 207.26]|uniref:KR-domain-containing protein n=1 Tax=Zopfia rhizophila CBS 207.26 TaxID=1314779 RepID=A0A6A6E3X4_9PEZI|nr:KR-domain-containing protein [Zopfia rhizophila CBS 207.26]
MLRPHDLSFIKASSLPLAAITAHYGLNHLARLRPRESVLIHAAAGAVGQLAIQLAQKQGATIFVTVSTKKKKELLMNLYGIDKNHFFSGRNLNFTSQVMRITKGQGVDVVLNSLAGEALVEPWRCVTPLGRFIKIGKRDINAFASLPMAPFAKNSSSGFEEAFRYLQTGRHSGNAVVDWTVEDTIKFNKNSTYVIAGGLGGIGRSIARWMAIRGAKYLMLLSRSGAKGPAAEELVEDLKAQGVEIRVPLCDISDKTTLLSVIQEYERTIPQIRGLIHSGMVVKNAMFDHMTRSEFQATLDPKIRGTWNLHDILPKEMDFFVLFYYAAGGAFQDAFSRYCLSEGLPCASLDLGAVSSVGYLAENMDTSKIITLSYTGHEVLDENDPHFPVEYACSPAVQNPESPWDAQLLCAVSTPAQVKKKEHAWMQKPVFRHLYQMDKEHVGRVQEDSTAINYGALIKEAKCLEEAGDVIATALAKRLSRSLSVPGEDLDLNKPAYSFGVDSLVAIEL